MVKKCHVQGCMRDASPVHQTCDEETHRALETHAKMKGRGMFQLKSRLKRNRMAANQSNEDIDPLLDLADETDTSTPASRGPKVKARVTTQ